MRFHREGYIIIDTTMAVPFESPAACTAAGNCFAVLYHVLGSVAIFIMIRHRFSAVWSLKVLPGLSHCEWRLKYSASMHDGWSVVNAVVCYSGFKCSVNM